MLISELKKLHGLSGEFVRSRAEYSKIARGMLNRLPYFIKIDPDSYDFLMYMLMIGDSKYKPSRNNNIAKYRAKVMRWAMLSLRRIYRRQQKHTYINPYITSERGNISMGFIDRADLSADELDILYRVYYTGETTKMIAIKTGRGHKDINQIHKKSLEKLKIAYLQ